MNMKNICPTRWGHEEEFVIAVLSLTKETYGEDAKYLNSTKMVKLAALVADKMDYNLTKGWYRYGYFSPTAWEVVRTYTQPDFTNLTTFNPPNELVTESLEKFKNEQNSILSKINEFKEYFVLRQQEFLDWVYEVTTPQEYRSLYLTHKNFEMHLDNFIRCVKAPQIFKQFLDKLIPRLEELVTQYHQVIKHIKDENILDLFYDFMDLLEMITLKITNKECLVNERELLLLDELKELYIGDNVDIWLLLVPYNETLTGPVAELEKIRHAEKVSATKKFLEEFLEKLSNDAKELNLLPSAEELKEKIRRLEYPGRRPIREIYESI